MISFFEQIVSYLVTFVGFVVSFITNLITLLVQIPVVIATITNTLVYIPPFLSVPIYAVVSLSLIIAIVNKWG